MEVKTDEDLKAMCKQSFEEATAGLAEGVVNPVFDACEKCFENGIKIGKEMGHAVAVKEFSDEIKSLKTKLKLAGII